MDTQVNPCSVTRRYQSWGILTGGYQEASAVIVHDVPVLQRGMKVENTNSFICFQPYKMCMFFIKQCSFYRLRTEFKCLY